MMERGITSDAFHAGDLSMDSQNVKAIPVLSMIYEKFRSKLAIMTDIKLFNVDNKCITIDVCDKYLTTAFDVINQHMISVFGNYIDKKSNNFNEYII